MDQRKLNKIKDIENEIIKWKNEIGRLDLLPCQGDRDLREKELSIASLEKIIRELENERDRLGIQAMHPPKKFKEKSFKENERISEDVIWIGTKKRDNRHKDRHFFEKIGDVSVEFRFEKKSKKYRVCNANVVDSSRNGFAVLIPQSGRKLVEILGVGDRVHDIAFFGIKAQIKRDGIVKHITGVQQGTYSDCYIMGIEAPDWSIYDKGKAGRKDKRDSEDGP